MVFNYQMASLLRLVANPPYIFPRAIFPQAPFAAPSDSNPWYYYTQRWICSYRSTPSQGVIITRVGVRRSRKWGLREDRPRDAIGGVGNQPQV